MKWFLFVLLLLGLSGCSGVQENTQTSEPAYKLETAQADIEQWDESPGGSIIVGDREFTTQDVWEYLADGSGTSNSMVCDIYGAVNMKHLELEDRYLLWWFDEHGRVIGLGDVAKMLD